MTRATPLAAALVLLPLVLALPVAAAGPDLAAAYAAVKADLSAGEPGKARDTYEAQFAPLVGAFPVVAERITTALEDAVGHDAAGDAHAYALDRQVLDKSLLQAAFLGTVAELREGDVASAGAWFGVLRAKFPNAAEPIAAFEAMERSPSTIPEKLPAFEAAMAGVFAGKVGEEVQEALGAFDDAQEAEVKAVEGTVYAYSLQPHLGKVLGAAQAEALGHELEELREAVVARNKAAAQHAADEVLALLAAYEAGGAPVGSQEQVRFLSALDALVLEYNEYVRDGVVVDRAKYDAEVLGLFLPQVHNAWAALRPQVDAAQAGEGAHLDTDIAALDARVREPAANTVVEAAALDLRSDVERILGQAASGAAPSSGAGALAALREAEARVDEAVQAYATGDRARALELLASAYLDIYAPRAEASIAKERNAAIERVMNVELRDLMQRGASLAAVQAKQAELHEQFAAAALDLQAPKTDAGLFANSFIIIAREGFEAALVLAAVIAYLVRSGHKDRTRQVYLGAGLAVGASLLLFGLVNTVLPLTGASRELMEGATALLAVAVLFYVSYWLIDKVEIRRWNRFIQGKVRSALTGGSHYALVSVAFLAVFREGLETVLFYQALLGGATSPSAGFSVLAGFVIGFAVLAVVFLGFTRYGVKIPMRPFFMLTSAMLYILAFSFMGAGIHELQEARVVGTTALPGVQAALNASPALAAVAGFLGIFATVQTLAAQSLLVLAGAGGLAYTFVVKPRRETPAPPAESSQG